MDRTRLPRRRPQHSPAGQMANHVLHAESCLLQAYRCVEPAIGIGSSGNEFE
ncbi:unnamed protein product, partial [Ectocarpus sp. 13 AM-2016]